MGEEPVGASLPEGRYQSLGVCLDLGSDDLGRWLENIALKVLADADDIGRSPLFLNLLPPSAMAFVQSCRSSTSQVAKAS